MTLILSTMSRLWVVQVSDRVLSQQQVGGESIQWDPISNKSILLLAANGSACISFSGLAHIAGKPTDQWIAEAIRGEPLGPMGNRGEFVPTKVMGTPRPVQLGPAIDAVVTAMETEFPQEPRSSRKLGLRIAVTGWTWKRRVTAARPPRPFMQRMTHTGADGSEVTIRQQPRHTPLPNFRYMDVGAKCDEELKPAMAGLMSVNEDSMEAAMAVVIRKVATRTPSTVGRDLMSLVIMRNQASRVRFLRDPAGTDLVAYTPWIITPWIISPPQVITGDARVTIGGVVVDSQPMPPHTGKFGSAGQHRKPPP